MQKIGVPELTQGPKTAPGVHPAKARSPLSTAVVRPIIRPARDDVLTAAVVLVSVTTAVLSASAMTAAPAWACARGLRGAAAVALGFSKVFPRLRIPVWRCHAPSSSDRRQVPGVFPAP